MLELLVRDVLVDGVHLVRDMRPVHHLLCNVAGARPRSTAEGIHQLLGVLLVEVVTLSIVLHIVRVASVPAQ